MTRTQPLLARLLYWLFGVQHGLFIDMERVNQEECRLRRIQLDVNDDQEARQRIKDRMMQGYDCKHRPWYEPARRHVILRMRHCCK